MSLQGTLNALIVQYYILFQDTFMFSKEVIIPHTVQIVHNIIFFGLYSGFGSDELGAFTFDIVSSIQFWFTLLITLAIALVPVIISRKFDILLNDNIINNLRNRRYEADFTKKMYIKKIEHMMKCTRNLARFKKIYNALDKFEADNFADRKMKDIVDLYRNLKNRKITRDKNSNKKIRQAGQRLKKPKSQSLDQKVKTLNIQIVKGNTIGKRMSNEDIKILVDGAIKNSEVSSSGELNIKIPDDVVVNFDIENECEVVDDINTRVFDSPYQVESNRESEICLENKETVLNIDTDTAIIAANKEKEDKKESDSVRNN